MLVDKLAKLIDKYNYGFNKEISVLTDNQSDENIIKLLKKYELSKIKSHNSNFNQTHIILFSYENHKLYDEKTFKFINEYLNKHKIIILVVPLIFDFDSIVKKSVANSIDAISWKDEHGKKYKNYIIVLNKD